ncbi:GNAT family N-acetyltransferase [Isoptericola hypogeus]|uniref:GNAT family N-acetyltransferase n=1 Tax=Isoptericola hypogeus TaxID=300179 RepID=A0ABN2JDX3_9MICO
MTTNEPRPVTVRRVRADEWREVKELRLAALQDPVAHLAFLETHDEAAAKPDGFWRGRAEGAASGGPVAQYVAVDDDGRWLGTVTGLLEEPGQDSALGGAVQRRQVHLVGVFVRPEARGAGILQRLFAAAQGWGREQGVELARLCVHVDNSRARAAYLKAGFAPSGTTFTLDAGEELEMVRPL